MPQVNLNYIAIIVVALIPMAVGMLWYSPMLFGNLWLKLVGKKKEGLDDPNKAYIISAITALIMSYALAHFVQYVNADSAVKGAQAGFWLWLGFVATSNLPDYIYSGRSIKIYKLSVGYHLVSMLLMGAVLAVWR